MRTRASWSTKPSAAPAIMRTAISPGSRSRSMPMTSWPTSGYASRPQIPIAVGESLYSLSQFKDYLQNNACSIVQVDVGRIGGITPWLKVAHMAEAFNVPVCPHFLMEIHLPLCCAVPNSRWLEFIPQLDLVTRTGMKVENGYGVPSEEPGLGIDWDWSALDKMVVHRKAHG